MFDYRGLQDVLFITLYWGVEALQELPSEEELSKYQT